MRKHCENCKRTLGGFLQMCWGLLWLPAFHLFGAKWYLRNENWQEKIGLWIICQVGWGRNPNYPSASERKTCNHKLGLNPPF